VRTPRGEMELKALVAPTIRPDTLFIPFHYGHREAVNQLTNAAVDPAVKIPEYKVCAAAVERLDADDDTTGEGPRVNYTPANAPKMFPYAGGESQAPQEQEGKRY
jgi:assimilatory nitrate reductase catalytic subunit